MNSLPDKSVHSCLVFMPLRGVDFPGVHRVLRDDGTLWLCLNDERLPNGDLQGDPWKTAFSLQAEGWFLRQDIIWSRPEGHRYLFLLTKSPLYYFDHEVLKEPTVYPPGTRKDVPKGAFKSKYAGDVARVGDESFRAIRETRNKRSVWTCGEEDVYTFCIQSGSSPTVCSECAAPWWRVMTRTCGECKAGVPLQAKTCPGCGHHVRVRSTSPQVGPSNLRGFGASCAHGSDPTVATILDLSASSIVEAAVLKCGRIYICPQGYKQHG